MNAPLAPIKQAKLFYYQLPFASPINFNGHRISAREGLIVQLQDQHQQLGLGEIAPLPGFSHESLAQAKAQIISLLDDGLDNLQPGDHLYPSVNFALSMALQKMPISEKVNLADSIPLLQGDNASVLKQYSALQYPSLIKLKVARQKVDDDLCLFQALSRLNPGLRIRCDANQAWSTAQAAFFFKNIDKSILDYIEEPTGCHQANLQLAKQYEIALALDETLQDIHFNYQHKSAIKALVLKPSLIGSLTRLQRFIDIAAQRQLQVHISSSFESIIGLQQLAALAKRYQKKCSLTLGIDTLKYFHSPLLTEPGKIRADLQKLECIWSSS